MKHTWSVGDVVEVAGDPDEGFPASWSTGSVKEFVGGSTLMRVQYHEFIDTDGTPLEEQFDVSSIRLRPSLPKSLYPASLGELRQIGHSVEVFAQSCWWSAVVQATGTESVTLALPEVDGRLVEASALGELRLGYVWSPSKGLWRRKVPSRAVLRSVGFSPATIMQATQELKECQMLFTDGSPVPEEDGDGDDDDDDGDDDYEGMDRGSAKKGQRQGIARSQRTNKNRIVWVDGHPVLKENLYDLEDGEPSVFAKELNKGKALPAGVSLTAPKSHRGGSHQAKKAASRAAPAAKAVNPIQMARMMHNEAIKKDTQVAEAARAVYLKSHLDKISAFIPNSVVQAIKMRAAAAGPHLMSHEPAMEQPPQITATLREYQMLGLQWLVKAYDHGINAILADEMGLGKTLQTITFLAYLKFVRNISGPHLVVVPLSVLPNWMSEFKRWCPELRCVRLHVNDEGERQRLRKEVLADPRTFDVAVTTYDMVHSAHFGDALRSTIVWRYLVLDEGHKVKNEETLISQSMRRISKQHALMLTGTPVQNNLHELYALLNFMYPDIFTDPSLFDAAFNLTKNEVDDNKLEAAHYLLRPFMLRRVKDEVECALPPRLETRINCPLSEMQTFWYRRLLLREASALQSLEGEDQNAEKFDSGGNSWKKAMNLLMQLRKVCNHPYMFPDSEPDYDGQTTGEDIVEGSGKMAVLDKLLGKLKARGHRVVLFSQFNLMLDIIEDYLVLRGYKYRRLDGSTNRIQRMIDIETFNKPNSDIFIYILCTRAGGLGVNLQTADTLVLYDSDWNPQWDLQAMARVHRIGQTKPVHVYRLCTEGTVEDRIQKRAEQKLYLDQMVNRGSTAAAEELEALDKKELLSMLRFGADRIFKNDSGAMPSDEQLDAILDRSHMLADQAEAQKLKEASHEAQQVAKQVEAAKAAHEAAEAAAAEAAAKAASSGEEGEAAAAAAAVAAAAAAEAFQKATQVQEALQEQQAAAAGLARAVKAEETAGGHMAGPSGSSEAPTANGGPHAATSAPDAVKAEAPAPAAPPGEGEAAGKADTTAAPAAANGHEHQAAAGTSGVAGLVESKRTALEFDATQAPISSFMLAGVDYKALREIQGQSLRDIAAEWSRKKRERKSRLVEVAVEGLRGKVAVLQENMYTLQQGGISINAKKEAEQGQVLTKGKRQIAGDDYAHMDYCQCCWDGGELLCCDYCPAAYHPGCLGMDDKKAMKLTKWACPHHNCSVCGRNTAAAGGLLFRCEMCEGAYCEDHLPEKHVMMGECEHFQALGQIHPKQACFILCGPQCVEQKDKMAPTLKELIEVDGPQYLAKLQEQRQAQKALRDELRGKTAAAATAAAGASKKADSRRRPAPKKAAPAPPKLKELPKRQAALKRRAGDGDDDEDDEDEDAKPAAKGGAAPSNPYAFPVGTRKREPAPEPWPLPEEMRRKRQAT